MFKMFTPMVVRLYLFLTDIFHSSDSPDSIPRDLYHPNGTVRHKQFNKTVVSNTERRYDGAAVPTGENHQAFRPGGF